jgi:hypothetical protein
MVYNMLQKIYGDIQFKFKADRISTRIEDYRSLEVFESLSKIHASLYVPRKQLVIETDEIQHFTYPRYLSLKGYPQSLKVGYDLEWYMKTCQTVKSVDNDPKYRDEQRAWYDTIRDFLPSLHNGVQLTIRIPLGFHAWCSLDPTNRKDVDLFVKHALTFTKE